MPRAGIRRPTSDSTPRQGGTVPRADARRGSASPGDHPCANHPAPRARRGWRAGGGAAAGPRPGSSDRGRSGRVETGPPQHLVGQQVADAGDAGLVEQAGLERGIARRPGRRAAAPRRSPPRRCRAAASSGSSSTPPSRRGSRSRMAPPSAKSTPNRSHRGSLRSLEYSSRSIAARPSTSRRPVMPNRRPSVGPSATSSSSSLPMRRSAANDRPSSASVTAVGGEPALQEPGVGRVDADDRAAERARREAPVLLDLQHLGHGASESVATRTRARPGACAAAPGPCSGGADRRPSVSSTGWRSHRRPRRRAEPGGPGPLALGHARDRAGEEDGGEHHEHLGHGQHQQGALGGVHLGQVDRPVAGC